MSLVFACEHSQSVNGLVMPGGVSHSALLCICRYAADSIQPAQMALSPKAGV